jgi:sugar/nucleoside kinase (ribokinase family)
MFNPGAHELNQSQQLKGLLSDVDVLLVNKEEAKQMVAGETLDELLAHMLNLVGCAIISDGSNGAIASDGTTKVRSGMYEDMKLVDRTGAGDAFGSGFLTKWAAGSSLKEAMIFASANSSSVVSYIGAKTGIIDQKVKLHAMPISETRL